MIEQCWLDAAARIVGTTLCIRSSQAGCLLVPVDWSKHRAEPFWGFARQRLPLTSDAAQAVAALIHLHGQWTGRRPQARSTRGRAADWLEDTLIENGQMTYTDLRQHALLDGVPWDSVRRASQRLGVSKRKVDFRGPWIWELSSEVSHSNQA
jgi:hypothetical protein